MQLYITKSGTAFKVSTYRADEPVQPWIGLRAACMVLVQNGIKYAQFELNALKRKRYSEMTMFERGVYSECEHYVWCVNNNRKYFTLSK
jgi:hypothetical protein